MLDVVVTVVLVGLVLRGLAGRGTTPLGLLAGLAAAGLGLWRGLGAGPGWLVALAVVALLVTVGQLALAFAVGRRIRPADPEELRAEVLGLAGRESAAPEQMVLAVAPTGAVMLQGVRPGAVVLTYGCPLCFVEETVDALVGPEAPVVAAYRSQVVGGVNRLVELRRGTIDGRWHADLRPVNGPKRPFRPPFCPVHT
ncbi:hypothetical protein [Kitasatospora sp. NPDC051914]|uniref:hypothetical protein n=1 Tax=Kitasatospora sp. NPDC051914 TaxID=3154945 RepID=UPI0034146FDC